MSATLCVGQTNGVGLSRAKFEEGAGQGLVAVLGVTEGHRTGGWVIVGPEEANSDGLLRSQDAVVLRPRPRRTQESQAAASARCALSVGGPVAGMDHLSEWTAARMAVMASGSWMAAMTLMRPPQKGH